VDSNRFLSERESYRHSPSHMASCL